jgi:hypothetical protein
LYLFSKLEKFAEEEQSWIKRFQLSSKLSDRTRQLEKEVSIQKREVFALQKAVADMQDALTQERKINTKLCGENDRLRVSLQFHSKRNSPVKRVFLLLNIA